MTKKHKLSPRGQRRAAERAAVQLAKDRVAAAKLVPGGAPERPLAVASASVIELRARDTPCAVCAAGLILEEHEAVAHDGEGLRRLRLVCKECHAPRVMWFRIEQPMVH
jgi:hypothetical protein